MIKICQQCGVEYNTHKPKRKYCSLECNYKSRKNKQLKFNKYEICSEYAIIYTESKKYGTYKFIIDIEDVAKVSNFYWYLKKDSCRTYALSGTGSGVKGKPIRLHRFIMNTPENLVCDHINRDTLNNRKSNLRNVTHVENSRNQSISKSNKTGYKYISNSLEKITINNKTYKYYYYILSITLNGKKVKFKRFKTLEDALKARELFFKNNPQYTLIE